MPAPTLPGPLDGAEFGGKSKSFTVLPGGRNWPTCRKPRQHDLPVALRELRRPHDRRLEADRRCLPLQVRQGPSGPPAAGGRRCLNPCRNFCEGRRGIHGDPGQYSADAIGERAGKWAATTKATG
jgi:hypothetical protein